MKGFIDLHTHILPDVDDGAQNMSDALALVRMAFENGTRTLILTPHYRGRFKENTPQWLEEVFSVFSRMVKQQFPAMELYFGNEIYCEIDAPELATAGRILSINHSRYVLLEFSPGVPAVQVIRGVSDMVDCGFTPIIAHAERYTIFRKQPSLAEEVRHLGALIQLNADSVMGMEGPAIKKYCHDLLKRQLVHFIASDAHDAVHRPPLLRESFLQVHKKYGAEYAIRVFSENAQAVIENRIV